MRPSQALESNRMAIREAVGRFRTANPRVFGSALMGSDGEASDLDILVDALPGATLLDLAGLEIELAARLGVRVDVKTPGDLPASFRDRIVREAAPV